MMLAATIDLAPLLHEILLPIASALGMVLAQPLPDAVRDCLVEIQHVVGDGDVGS